MEQQNLFLKIVKREIPADIVYQDDRVTAFRDINPAAPTHVLIVPNYVISSTNEISAKDAEVLAHMMFVARDLAKKEGIDQTGYRLSINCGPHAGQEVYHLHLHLVGGCQLGHHARPRQG